jgi:hypothetical protein
MQKIQKPRFKHNKKRNTAFLFEALVKELTKSVIYGDKDKQKTISRIIKEHFNKNNVLSKELSLYKQIYETNEFPKEVAEKLINKLKEEHENLNESDIYNEQSKLIAKVNKAVGPDVYSNFVPNYKTLATISQIFNKEVETKKKILLEQELINNITAKPVVENKDTQALESAVINRFVERFNEAYNNDLLSEQKVLLSKYINSSEDDVELKLYVNEELIRLKNELKAVSENDSTGNSKKIFDSLSELKIQEINETLIKKLMYAQQFIHEVKN